MTLFLKIFFALMFVVINYTVIVTSLESNLFEELGGLLEIPWMVATLVDFYINIAIIALWMFYKERNPLARIAWLISFVCLGAIATTFYVLIQVFRLQPGEGVAHILLRRDVPAAV